MNSKDSIIKLLKRFEDRSHDYHESAQELRTWDKEIAICLLTECLNDSNSAIRYYASDLLIELDSNNTIINVLPLLFDPDKDIRLNICTKLCYYGDPRVVSSLVDVLKTDTNSDIRSIAAVALGRIGDSRAIPALEWAITHDEGLDFQGEPIRYTAARAIGQINHPTKSSSFTD